MQALLKRVKSLSTTQYLVSAAREGAMASLLAAPALLVGFTLQGMIVARFPLLMRGRAGVEPEPAPQWVKLYDYDRRPCIHVVQDLWRTIYRRLATRG